MPKGKILGATCKALTEATLAGATKQVVTTDLSYITMINVTSAITVNGTAGSAVISVLDSGDNVIAKLVTGASGEGSISFPAPLPANGIKLVSVATIVGKVVVYVI